MSGILLGPAWRPMTWPSWAYWVSVNAATPILYAIGWLALNKHIPKYDPASGIMHLQFLALAAAFLFAPIVLFGRAFRNWVSALEPPAWALCVVAMIAATMIRELFPEVGQAIAQEKPIFLSGSAWQLIEPAETPTPVLLAPWHDLLLPHALWALLFWSVPAVILGRLAGRPNATPILLAAFVLGSCAAQLAYAMFEIQDVTRHTYLSDPANMTWPARLEHLTLMATAHAVGAILSAAGIWRAFPGRGSTQHARNAPKITYCSFVAALFVWHAGATVSQAPALLS